MLLSLRKPPIEIILVTVLIAILLNAFLLVSSALGLLLLVFWGYFTASRIGDALPITSKNHRGFYGLLLLICSMSIVGTGLYYILPLSNALVTTLLVIVTVISMFLPRQEHSADQKKQHYPLLPAIGFFVSTAAWIVTIAPIAITEATRTVWDFLHPSALISLTLAGFFAILLSIKRPQHFPWPFIMLLFLGTSIAAFVFPFGFGFDPFIHRATVQHILDFGTITPKPLYYIGQYIIEVIAAHTFALPLHILDRFLAPVFFSVFVAGSAWTGFFSKQNTKALALGILVFLGFSSFITTTPQALSYVWTLSLLFLSLPWIQKEDHAAPYALLMLLAIAALATHPLAGIPALLYLLAISLYRIEIHKTIKHLLWAILGLGSAVALPAVFVLQAYVSGIDISFTPAKIFSTIPHIPLFLQNSYDPFVDAISLVSQNTFWMLLILTVIGIATTKGVKQHAILLPVLASILWFINYWLLANGIEFSFLIEYERLNYANRLLFMSMLFFLPAAGYGLQFILTKTQKQKDLYTVALAVIAICFAINVYASYPRDDAHERSAGFSVGQSDIDAAWAIHQQNTEIDYIVLANQSVSAAALEQFGFLKYFKDNTVFYYPIPTGGELYTYYLDMTDNAPMRETMLSAMDVAGVDHAYFVVNAYWWDADRIIEHAKQEADTWFGVGNGEVMIFEYNR